MRQRLCSHTPHPIGLSHCAPQGIKERGRERNVVDRPATNDAGLLQKLPSTGMAVPRVRNTRTTGRARPGHLAHPQRVRIEKIDRLAAPKKIPPAPVQRVPKSNLSSLLVWRFYKCVCCYFHAQVYSVSACY